MSISKKTQVKIIAATTAGSILEWYEFSLYGYLSPIIANLFFSSYSQTTAIANTFIIFAVGFLARPFSAIIFGYVGDRYGRRIALLSSIIFIFLPTLGIGFLPTSLQIGLLAPLFLGLLRFLQGFAAGGELPGAMCYLAESVGPQERCYMSSWAFVGSQLGSIISIIEALFLQTMVAPEFVLGGGWRISFIIGGVIGLCGFFLRYRLHETLPFEDLKKRHEILRFPLKRVLNNHKMKLLIGFLISVLSLAGYRLVFVFSVVYFRFLGMSIVKIAIINVILLFVSTLGMPIIGKLGNKFRKKPLLIACALGIMLLSYPLYFSAAHSYIMPMLVLNTLIVLLLTVHFAILPFFLAELYPTDVRYTCMGLSYNICNAVLGGTVPLIAFYFLEKTTNYSLPSLILIFAALFTIVGLFMMKEKKHEAALNLS